MRHSLTFLILFLPTLLLSQEADEQEQLYFDLIDKAREFVLAAEHDSAWQTTINAAAIWKETDPFFGYLAAFEETATFYISKEFQQQTGRKDYKTAAKYFEFALENFPGAFQDYEAEEVEYLADINAMLGNAYKRSSRILESKKAYEKGFAGYRHLDSLTYDYDKRWVALYVYKPLANIYTRLENYENATSLLLLAQSILETDGKEGEAAQAAIDLGILFATTERHRQAIAQFDKYVDNPHLSDYIKSVLLLNRARSYMNLSESQPAFSDINTAIFLLKKENKTLVLVDAYHILGQLQSYQGNTTEALQSLNQAIESGKKVLPEKSRKLAKIYASLGNLYLQQNDASTALSAFQKSLNAVMDLEDSEAIPATEHMYAENSILTALDGKAVAYEKLSARSGDFRVLEKALLNLQAAFEVERLLQNTQQHSSSKIQFQRQNQSRREKAIRLCVILSRQLKADHYLETAFEIAEAGKAAVLLESVRENLARREVQGTQILLQKIKETEKALAEIKSELLVSKDMEPALFDQLNEQKVYLSQKLMTFNQTLAEKHPEFDNRKLQQEIITADEVRELLLNDPSTAFVEFFRGTETLYVFKIGNEEKLTLTEIPVDEAFFKTITGFLELFSAENRWNIGAETFQNVSFDLYKKLVEPLELTAYSELIIVPDGILAFIPFEALVSEIKSEAFFKNLDYLIYKKNIRYAYSGSVLKQQLKSSSKSRDFLFVAPGFENTKHDLPPLDASDLDVGKPRNLQQLLNSAATRNNFETAAENSRIIHLFTHAEANPENNQPKVYFYDEALPLSEIYALDLSADLVVLSACETNLGKMEKGEGVMSLARGFAYAGASSLIASLWKVKNRETAQVFSYFYENLQSGEQKSRALRSAKLQFLQETNDIHASPAYWTGFVFIGNDNQEKRNTMNIWLLIGIALLAAGAVMFLRRG